MKLSIKNGVSLLGVQPVMMLAAVVVSHVYEALNNADCIITSGTEGKHRDHSHHRKGLALDFRIRNVRQGWHVTLQQRTQQALGSEFQVVLSSNCIHVEFDPK
jgi:hypothetical protein